MTDLLDALRTALAAREARWFDGLAWKLAANAWAKLASIGIEPSNYGTARILRANPAAPRMGFLMRDAGLGRPVPLERYDTTMLARYGVLGLREPSGSFDAAHFESELARALRLIDIVPAAGDAVRALVWSITPVDVEGPEYDTGYSDPAVPFSIFIGAHAPEDGASSIRVAEGVLHETMHLQLSLLEDLVPLVGGSAERRYSPWQGRQRPAQGILHGLYVFRVVQDWLRALVLEPKIDSADLDHAYSRIALIDEECAGLADFARSEDLTEQGRAFASCLTA